MGVGALPHGESEEHPGLQSVSFTAASQGFETGCLKIMLSEKMLYHVDRKKKLPTQITKASLEILENTITSVYNI